MVENAKKMCCGACGHDQFSIYQTDDGLVVECKKPECKSTSTVTVKAEIKIGFGDNSDGRLCVF
jgi:hypothetical protein